jgi:hypothetical protein
MKLRMGDMQMHSGTMYHLRRRTFFLLERDLQLLNMINGLQVPHVMLNLDQEDHERFPSLPEAQPSTRKMTTTMTKCSIRREGESNH